MSRRSFYQKKCVATVAGLRVGKKEERVCEALTLSPSNHALVPIHHDSDALPLELTSRGQHSGSLRETSQSST